MCIVRERELCSDDLAVLSGNRFVICEPEEAIPGLVIREKSVFLPQIGPVCLSQIVRTVNRVQSR